MSEALHSSTALSIVHRMGESGLPPEEGVEEVNVGTDSYLAILETEYLSSHLCDAGGSTFKLIQGTYGAGKTHFLYCLKARAGRRGYLTSIVTLTAAKGECPFDSPLHIFRATAQNLTQRTGPGRAVRSGLTDILRDWVERESKARGAEELKQWLSRSLARSPISFQPFRVALVQFLLGVLRDDDGLLPLEGWLLGRDVPAAQLRSFGVYDSPREQNAFLLLRSMTQAMRELGFPGVVLLFDEGEKQLSFARVDARSTREVLNNLRETIDLCGRSELPSTLVAYAVTPDFVNNILPRYPALQQRLLFPVANLSVNSPLAPVIDLEILDLAPPDLLRQLGQRLSAVYRTAYGWAGDPALMDRNLQTLVHQTLSHQLEVGHRRVFVKSWLRLLDEGRRGGVRLIDDKDAWDTVRSAEESFTVEEEFEDS